MTLPTGSIPKLSAVAACLALWALLPRHSAAGGAEVPAVSRPAVVRPAPTAASKPKDNLDYWLNQSKPTSASAPASSSATATSAATAGQDKSIEPSHEDTLPGVIEFSNGKLAAGMVFTTRGKPFQVWVEAEQKYRQVPLINVLSINAVVEDEHMELEWRWKEMGFDERVYTGRSYPVRQFAWKVNLIDGSSVSGTIKGQPLFMTLGSAKLGPFLFQEKANGDMGQKLADFVYLKRLVISRRAMDEALKDSATSKPK